MAVPSRKPRVAFLGPLASFSHQAAVAAFGPNCCLQPKTSFPDALSGLQSMDSDYAIIPFENSTNGSVVQALDLLANRQGAYDDIGVCSEYYLTVHQCLLMRKPPSSSSKSMKERYATVRKLYTHPQAWGQCERYLSKHFNGVERQDTSSTSKAAEIAANLAEDEADTAAAIASSFAADINDKLETIAENIEDVSGNTTRFLILRNFKAPTNPDPLHNSKHAPPARRKTLISFEIDHNQPGALARALVLFKEYGLNLTSINSRPGLVRPWQYIFFIECERASANQEQVQSCHAGADDAVREAIGALQEVTESCRWLGSWANQLE